MIEPIQRTPEAMAKSKLMDMLYKWHLQNQPHDWVEKELARKDLPRMSEMEWQSLRQFFRERELSRPRSMSIIRAKIGWSTRA